MDEIVKNGTLTLTKDEIKRCTAWYGSMMKDIEESRQFEFYVICALAIFCCALLMVFFVLFSFVIIRNNDRNNKTNVVVSRNMEMDPIN